MSIFLALCFVILVIGITIKKSNERAEEEERKNPNPLYTKKILNEDIIQRYYEARRKQLSHSPKTEKNLRENIEKYLSDSSAFCLISFYKINKVTPSYIVKQCCNTYIIHKSLINLFSADLTSNCYCEIWNDAKVKNVGVFAGKYHILYSEKDIELDYDFLKNFLKTP